MPTTVGPNTYGEENLVFGYDLGDVSNSYKGEPTTNLITHVLPNGNWNTNGAGVIITQNYGYDHNGVLRSSKIMDNPSSGNSSFAYTSAFNVSAGTYTFSAMVKTSSANASSNSEMTLYNMNPITQLGSFSFTNLTPGVWTKVSVTGTLASGTTHIAPHFYSLAGDGTNFIEVVDVQLEQKSHATPFAGANGTRSATQGLLDLTGNSTINLSNVSFDSNAQMTFDGTDDIITIPSATWNILTAHTLEAVFKANGTGFSGYHVMFQKEGGYSGGAVYGLRAANAGGYLSAMICYDAQSASQNNLFSSTTVTNGQYYHVVATFDSSYNWKIYINGVLENETTLTGNPYQNSSSISIGRGDSRTMNGDLPIAKIYNRTLTAQEVKSNFNAIKGRFNI